jgi:ABC-2 type transport system ATP-binding protein
MKRRLMIARALVHEPRLLILDEPTAGVDIEIRRSMWDYLRKVNAEGVTIILTTHYLEEAENLCRNVAIIDQGRIIENDRMSRVLRKLQVETFVLTLENEIDTLPVLDGYTVRQVDPGTLEVDVASGRGINELFQALSAGGVQVASMRNKANRLEELFIRLVDQKTDGRAA